MENISNNRSVYESVDDKSLSKIIPQRNDEKQCPVNKGLTQGLLYHRTCKRDFLCSWPSLDSYLA